MSRVRFAQCRSILLNMAEYAPIAAIGIARHVESDEAGKV